MSYKIFTDATSDMSADLLRDLDDVSVIPMEILQGGETVLVRQDDDAVVTAFYKKIRDGVSAQTSQINQQVYLDLFGEAMKAGFDVLYLCFSSALSGTINSALLAIDTLADDYPERKAICVDTQCASIGEGFLVHEAVVRQQQGMSMTELADWVEAHKRYVCQWFAVDSMAHLLRGGRVPATVANLGDALQIKPLLHVDIEGRLKLAGKARGKQQAMKKLTSLPLQGRKEELGSLILLGHADCMDDAQKMKETLSASYPDADIRISQIGPVVGSHTGPGMIAVVYWGENR